MQLYSCSQQEKYEALGANLETEALASIPGSITVSVPEPLPAP